MKTKSILYALLLTALVVLTSCSSKKIEEATSESSDETESAAAVTDASKPQFEVDASFQQQLAGFFSSYVELKDAFVASKSDQVKAEAAETDAALAKVDMKLLTGAAHNDWMTYLAPIQTSLKEIQASADLATQRKSFSTLSDNLYK